MLLKAYSPSVTKLTVKATFIICVCFLFVPNAHAQSYAFPGFSTGTISSANSGVSTALNTAGVSGDYLFYVVTADFAGTGGSPAFSNTMNLELSNGGATIYKSISHAGTGALNNSSSTSLTWTGVMNQAYSGGSNLTARFYDDYNTGGPFTSSLTNVTITIYRANSPQAFPSFSTGTISSANSGVSTALNTAGVSGDYLFYVVTADFAGTGGSPAFSNTMNLELSNGGATIYKSISHAGTGALNNSSSTSLSWTGVMNQPYAGGSNLTTRFYDDYNTGGPFTSSLTNVTITLYQAPLPHTFPNFSTGTISSANSGVSTALNTAGAAGDYLFFVATADFVGTGGSPAFSNTMNLELNNGGSTIYKSISHAGTGALNNSSSTSLTWTGVMNQPYAGGSNLTARFYDDYNTGGPFTSSLTNVSITIYSASGVPFPVELLLFEAQLDLPKQVVDLSWATASELNNSYFTVERSKDKEIWNEVSTVPGNGTTQEVRTYYSKDINPIRGTSYYRLKQTDYDGHFTYGHVRSVNNIDAAKIVVFPNPGRGVFTLQFAPLHNEQKHHFVKVLDSSGRILFRIATEESSTTIDLSNQPSGVYTLLLNAGQTVAVIKN